MTPSFLLAQADALPGTPPKRIVHIAKPENGQAVTVQLREASTLDFTSVAAEAITLVRVGDRLVVLFDNQATVTIAPAFDPTGQWVDGLTFEIPGRELAGADFAALFPVTGDLSVLPAAGALPGFAASGYFPGPSPVETLGDGRGPLALVDGSEAGPNFQPPFTSDTQPAAVTAGDTNEVPPAPNRAPRILSGPPEGQLRENAEPGETHGVIAFEDPDAADAHTATVTPTNTGYLGHLTATVSAAGEISWNFAADNAELDFLPEGETRTQTYTVTVDDGRGGSDTTLVTITIIGTNDVPVITGDISGNVREDADAPASGALTATDADTGQSALQAVTAATLSDSHYGSFTVTADGHWVYTLNDSVPGIQELPEDAPLTDSFTVWSQDGTVSQTVTIDIRGSNDDASITVPTEPVTALTDGFESGFAPTWNVHGTTSIDTQAPTEGTKTARIVGGDGVDESVGATDQQIETFLGLASGALDAVAQDNSAIDGSAIASTLLLAAGTYTLSFDWRYQTEDSYSPPWNDFAFMSIGGVVYVLTDVATVGDYSDSGWQHFTVTVNLSGATTLGFGAMNTGDEWIDGALLVDHVVLTGIQDGDHATVADNSGATVTGTLLVTDIDTGEAKLRTVAAGTSQYGTYTVAADGTWTYQLDDGNAAINHLGVGATTTDTFTVTSLDGTATHDVTITIQGANDAPTGADVSKSVIEEGTATFTAADFGFADIDTGDTLGGVKITTLPPASAGVLKLDGVSIAAGTVISTADLAMLTFVPVNKTDDYIATFTVQVADQHGTFDATPRTVSIAVDADNDAPDGGPIAKSVSEDSIAAGFAMFNFGFTDPDQGDTFTALKISSLPPGADGTLVLFDPNTNTRTPITTDTVLTKAQLEFIQFVPANKESSYDAIFTVQVQDPHGAFDPTPETVTVHVVADNDAPSIGVLSNIISEDAASFSADLLANANDIDTPVLTATNIPSQILTTDGRQLVAGLDYAITGSTFALTDHGFAQFQNLAAGYSDKFVLSYGVSDGTNTRATTLTVTVNGANEIGAVPTAPSVVGEISGLYASISSGNSIMTHPASPAVGPLPTSISYSIPADAIVVGNAVTWSMQVIYSSLQGTVSFNNSTNRITYDALPNTKSGMAVLKLTATDAWGQSVVTYTTVSALDDGVQGFADVYVSGNVPGAAGFIGGDGNDSISQSSGADNEANLLVGNGGEDYLVSNIDQIENGDDALYGGADNDVLVGGAGNDFLSGGDGHDRLIGGAGNDFVRGGAGDDTIYIAGSDAVGDLLIDGGTGNDRLFIGTLANLFTPTYAASAQLAGFGPANSIESIASVSSTDSTLEGTSANNTFDFYGTVLSNVDVSMGGGNDRVRTAVTHNNDDHTVYDGGEGTDSIVLNFTDAQLEQILADTEARVALRGFLLDPTVGLDFSNTSWNASVTGFEVGRIGIVAGGATVDFSGLFGAGLNMPEFRDSATTGSDLLIGDDSADGISGDAGNDIILGRGGVDALRGDGGNDLLLGGDGNDTLAGGAGQDVLVGGNGADAFLFESPLQEMDRILDFDRAAGDHIDILASAFGLTAGSNVGTIFGASATANAATADERFHFDTSTHTLYYDSDGSGAAAAIALARLENGANLQSGDLHLV
jgi:VCBS repeat-containing protein